MIVVVLLLFARREVGRALLYEGGGGYSLFGFRWFVMG